MPDVVTNTDQLEVQAEPTLRDQINEAVAQVAERQEAEGLGAAPTDAAGAPSPARDESGRFARPGTDKPAEASTGQAPAATGTQAQPAPAKAPDGWSPEAKAEWAKLPQHVQTAIARREEDVHKGFTKQDEERQFGRALREVIMPYMPTITAEGGDPIGAVKMLLNTAHIMRSADPARRVQLFRQLAQQYQVPLDQIVAAAQQGQRPPDPFAAAVQAAVAPLQQQLQQLTGARQAEVLHAQQQQMQSAAADIDAFAADPKHPHFETVRPLMGALIKEGHAKDLQDAYEQAIWARPDLRSSLIAMQTQAAQDKRRTDTRSHSIAARRASGSLSGGPGVTAATPPAGGQRSLRDDIRAAAATVSGRA